MKDCGVHVATEDYVEDHAIKNTRNGLEMGAHCQSNHQKYDVLETSRGGGHRNLYQQGYKRCTVCEMFVKWDGIRCPCCNFTLRTKPRYNMAKLADKRGVKRIAV